MRVTVKNTCCPWCAGELVVEDGKVTCISNCACHSEALPFHEETVALIQPVIDWQKQIAVEKGQTHE